MYFIANYSFENNKVRIEIREEISDEKRKAVCETFDFLQDVTPVATAYNISVNNGRELYRYLSSKCLHNLYCVTKQSPKEICVNANRMIFNLCASFKTFLDYSEKVIKRKGENEYNTYINLERELFDSCISYRFISKMRDFCIHYSFPFVKLSASELDNTQLFCEKEHLLKFRKWGAVVSRDLKDMPDIIDLRQHVIPLLECITALELTFYYFFAKEYESADHVLADLCKEYAVKTPIIVSGSETEIKALHPFPIEAILEGIKKLQNHPHVNIEHS